MLFGSKVSFSLSAATVCTIRELSVETSMQGDTSPPFSLGSGNQSLLESWVSEQGDRRLSRNRMKYGQPSQRQNSPHISLSEIHTDEASPISPIEDEFSASSSTLDHSSTFVHESSRESPSSAEFPRVVADVIEDMFDAFWVDTVVLLQHGGSERLGCNLAVVRASSFHFFIVRYMSAFSHFWIPLV